MATGWSSSWVERPTSRLSNRTTCRPASAMSVQSPGAQLSNCDPYPAISRTVGSDGSPNVSYSIVMPVAVSTAVMAGPGSHGSVLRRTAVDDEREDVLHDRLTGGLVRPRGLLHVELERAAARLRLLVDVDDLRRALEHIADL